MSLAMCWHFERSYTRFHVLFFIITDRRTTGGLGDGRDDCITDTDLGMFHHWLLASVWPLSGRPAPQKNPTSPHCYCQHKSLPVGFLEWGWNPILLRCLEYNWTWGYDEALTEVSPCMGWLRWHVCMWLWSLEWGWWAQFGAKPPYSLWSGSLPHCLHGQENLMPAWSGGRK